MVHVRATSEPDLFFGQGYVAARLRLWQMEYQRKLAAGRLAELIGGDDAVQTDKLVRTLGLPAAAASMLSHLDAGTRAAVSAYTKGVNAYVEIVRKKQREQPVEFFLYNVPLEEWTDIDSVGWLKILQWDLSGNLAMELQRYALVQRSLGAGRILELIPPYNEECPAGSGVNATCSDRGNFFPTVLRPADCPQCAGACCPPWEQPPPRLRPRSQSAGHSHEQLIARLLRMLHFPDGNYSTSAASAPGSLSSFGVLGRRPRAGEAQQNGWVIDGRFTTTGKPLLANDMHLAFTAPSASLLMHLECPTCDARHNWLPCTVAFRPPLICRRNCSRHRLLGLTLPCFAHRYEAIGTAYAGLPFIFVGHNRKIGWGMSQAGSDVQDLYVLTASGDGYTLDGATKAFETRTLHCTL
eukprot:COSAG06_NODE_2021_length_7833_cov_3.800233_6_plen_410_part_00